MDGVMLKRFYNKFRELYDESLLVASSVRKAWKLVGDRNYVLVLDAPWVMKHEIDRIFMTYDGFLKLIEWGAISIKPAKVSELESGDAPIVLG